MAFIDQGVNITTVDSSATFPLGTEIDDPRGNSTSGGPRGSNRFRYVKAGSAISAGNALVVSLADADEPNTLVPCSAVNQVTVAVAEVAIASGSYGWVQVKGRHAGAVNLGTISAGNKLTTSGTAGAFTTVAEADSNVTSTKLNAAIAMAAGIGVMALDSNDSNAAVIEVLIN
jgi:hypothetical protein